jgi:hypothetical protein
LCVDSARAAIFFPTAGISHNATTIAALLNNEIQRLLPDQSIVWNCVTDNAQAMSNAALVVGGEEESKNGYERQIDRDIRF